MQPMIMSADYGEHERTLDEEDADVIYPSTLAPTTTPSSTTPISRRLCC